MITLIDLKKEGKKYDFSVLNQIYHSEDMHEMLMKADLYCVDMHDKIVLCYLIETTTYHDAYWPHTAKRFIAFKNVLKQLHCLPSMPDFNLLVNHVKDMIEFRKNYPYKNTQGRKKELKNLKQVLDILHKLEDEQKTTYSSRLVS